MRTNKMIKLVLLSMTMAVFSLDTALAQSTQPTALKGDPGRGEILYQGCMDCHSIDKDDVGPRHRGVVGRRAGSIAGFDYSKALKNSGLTWDEATLDRWLIDPGALVPGTRMFYEVEKPQDRADLIAFLNQQK